MKNLQNAQISHDICPKNEQYALILHDICPKDNIIFPDFFFWGGEARAPVWGGASPTPMTESTLTTAVSDGG